MSVALIVAGLSMLLTILVVSNVAVHRQKKFPMRKPFGRYDDLLLAVCATGIPVAFIVFIAGVLLDASA